MRVGVLAGEMERRSTGVGRYLGGLLHGLARWDHGVEFLLLFQGDPFDHPLWRHDCFEPRFASSRVHPVLWEQLLVPWRIRSEPLDVLFCPAYTVPFGLSLPAVVTLHDLSFERFPGEFGWRERWRRRLLARRASRVARRVLVDTERVAGEVSRLYGVPERRIGVVPPAVEPELLGGRPGAAAELAELGIRRPFLLSLGTVLERRVPRLMLEAVARVMAERPDIELVVAGENRMRRPERLRGWVSELGIGDRVRLLDWVDDRVLPELYRTAELVLYLSRYEGYGLPPLEALAFGAPVVVGPGLALDDLWPDYPYRVEELETEGVARMIRRVLDQPEEAAGVVAGGAARILGGGWQRSSSLLVAELERAVEP
jgi:glycosyltransferase involved in cell wall biosynthesis